MNALEEFFRFGGPSVFPCGCSANDAVRISLDDVGTAAYPVGDGLDRSDIEDFRQAIGDEPILWWHDCPRPRERCCPQPHRSRLRRRTCDGRDHHAGSDIGSARDPYGRSDLLRGERRLKDRPATLAMQQWTRRRPLSLSWAVWFALTSGGGVRTARIRLTGGASALCWNSCSGRPQCSASVLAVLTIWRERRRAAEALRVLFRDEPNNG